MTKPATRPTRARPRPARTSAADGVTAVLGAADRARRFLAGVLEARDVTLQQYNVLRILRGAGEALPTMEIRARMLEHAPGITRIVDHLVAKGLVVREYSPTDRRRVLCTLTPAGRALLAELDDDADAADERLFADLDAGELDRLVRLLERVARGLPED